MILSIKQIESNLEPNLPTISLELVLKTGSPNITQVFQRFWSMKHTIFLVASFFHAYSNP